MFARIITASFAFRHDTSFIDVAFYDSDDVFCVSVFVCRFIANDGATGIVASRWEFIPFALISSIFDACGIIDALAIFAIDIAIL